MIEVYTWPTPNGHKVHIMLEETGLEYEVIPINISKGAQFAPDFLKLSPNNKMPAIVDTEGPGGRYGLFESGAILLYLAEKTGQLLPADPRERHCAVQWLMFQMGNLGPMLGQAHHFRQYAEQDHAYSVERYTNEASRLYGVLDKRLAEAQYLAGDEYSVADIACWPWLRRPERQGQSREDFPHLQQWFEKIGERPAVQRGVEVLADRQRSGPMTAEERAILFGAQQYKQGAA